MGIDILSIMFIIAVVGACIATAGIAAIFGFAFGLVMFILIRMIGSSVCQKMLGLDFKLFIMAKKTGARECVLFDAKYRMEHKGFSGVINVAMRITWIGLGVGLLTLRFVLDKLASMHGQNTGSPGIPEILLIGFLAVIVGTIFSPLAVPYWVINSSRVRIIDKKNGTIYLPGTILRSLFRGILGVGNIAVIAYFIRESINYTGNFTDGIFLAFIALSLVFGSVGLAGIMASILLLYKSSDMLNDVLSDFEDTYRSVAINAEEFLEMYKEYLPKEEAPLEETLKEEAEAIEKEEAIGEETTQEQENMENNDSQ